MVPAEHLGEFVLAACRRVERTERAETCQRPTRAARKAYELKVDRPLPWEGK